MSGASSDGLTLTLSARRWPLREPFVIARQTIVEVQTIHVRLSDGFATGCGEAVGLDYAGETPATMACDLDRVRPLVEQGIGREALLGAMPAGGARCALDAALWDLAAKRDGVDPFAACGTAPRRVASVVTIGMGSRAQYEAAARRAADARHLKVKVGAEDVLEAVAAVRRGAPEVPLIVDANQAWSVDQLKALAPILAEHGVDLLEQPTAVGSEAALDGWRSPVPLCADESVDDVTDLDTVQGRFDAINIKLDKAGGLTAALRLADAAEARGFALMVGSMAGPSLSVAPAMVLAQRCRWVDLDGPPMLVEDNPHGFAFAAGWVECPHQPLLWG